MSQPRKHARSTDRHSLRQWPDEVEAQPAELAVVDVALQRFVDTFVLPDRAGRAHFLLQSPSRRAEGLQAVQTWLDPTRRTSVLQERFGDMCGVYVEPGGACHLRIGDAVQLAEWRWGVAGLFIADREAIALICYQIGAPDLFQA